MIEYCGNDDIRIDQADVLIKSSGRCEESRPVHDILFIEPLLFLSAQSSPWILRS